MVRGAMVIACSHAPERSAPPSQWSSQNSVYRGYTRTRFLPSPQGLASMTPVGTPAASMAAAQRTGRSLLAGGACVVGARRHKRRRLRCRCAHGRGTLTGDRGATQRTPSRGLLARAPRVLVCVVGERSAALSLRPPQGKQGRTPPWGESVAPVPDSQ